MLRMVSEPDIFSLQGQYDLRSLCAASVAFDEGDDEGDEEEDEGDEGGEGDGGEGSSGAGAGDGKKDDKSGKTIKDPESHRLSREAAKYRRERNDLQTKLKQYEDKDKSELELAQRDAKEAAEERDALRNEVAQLKQLNLLLTSPAARQFKDVADALRLVDLSKLEADDDGNYNAKEAEEALNSLAKKYPAMCNADGSSSDGDEGSNGQQSPSGRPANGKGKTKKEDADRAALEKKFPVLAGRS